MKPAEPPHAATGTADLERPSDGRIAIRRAVQLLLALAACGLMVRAVIGERGLLETHRSRSELGALETDVAKWQARCTYLEGRIQELKTDPAAMERIARERLDWVRPGEITFLFPYDPAEPEPGDSGPALPGEFAPTQAESTAKQE